MRHEDHRATESPSNLHATFRHKSKQGLTFRYEILIKNGPLDTP